MIPSPRALALAFALLACAVPLRAQTSYFSESFDAGIPASFALTNNNGSAAVGWQPEAAQYATPAVWHDAEAGVGQADDDLDTPDFDLTTASSAYLHFESITRWANFQANHPVSFGNGLSAVEVSTDGGATWSSGFWVNTQVVSDLQESMVIDLGGYLGSPTTRLRFHYEGDFAHAWAIDDLRVDDDPNPPPPPATVWDFVALPTTFVAAAGFLEDFDLGAGVVQNYMAVTEVDAATLLPDPDSWANIGQHAPNAGTPYSGSYCAELSRAPGTTNYVMSRNALVFGLNGATGLELSFRLYEAADETHEFDGVWVSDDGTDWYRLDDAQANTYSWVSVDDLPLDATPADVSGDFYLMLAQQDNFPWGTDGIAFDDLSISTPSAPGPSISVAGLCGVPGSSVQFVGGTPSGSAALVWAFVGGSFTIPVGTQACVGTVLDLAAPTLAEIRVLDANGAVAFGPQGIGIPTVACGVIVVQVLDVATCGTSNVLAL